MTKPMCSIDGCENPSRKLGWCEKHYSRYKRHGDPEQLVRTPNGMTCLIDGCDAPNRGQGYCGRHYTRLRVHGDPTFVLKAPNGEVIRWLTEALKSRSRMGCWDWPYSVNDMGYGKLWFEGRLWYAHRLACHLDGRPAGAVARHRCDRPVCCNPDHIEPGTQRDNLQDMVRRGRALNGSRNPVAKLTEGQVVEIRRLYAAGWMQHEIADEFGITQTTVSRIVRRKGWRHVA